MRSVSRTTSSSRMSKEVLRSSRMGTLNLQYKLSEVLYCQLVAFICSFVVLPDGCHILASLFYTPSRAPLIVSQGLLSRLEAVSHDSLSSSGMGHTWLVNAPGATGVAPPGRATRGALPPSFQ